MKPQITLKCKLEKQLKINPFMSLKHGFTVSFKHSEQTNVINGW